MTAKTRPDYRPAQQTKYPIRNSIPKNCKRKTCVGCQYARIIGCAKPAS